jgi:L-rhamnose-H+ transport protein
MPLIIHAPGFDAPPLFSLPGLVVIAGMLVMILGVFMVARAGFAKDKDIAAESKDIAGLKNKGPFLVGLILAILAGILSTGISFTFVYTQEAVSGALREAGADTTTASVGVWAAGMLGAALVNVGWPAILITRRGEWRKILSLRDALLAALLGLHFGIAVMFLLGRGMVILGPLGASVGFGIQQAMQIIGNQGLGAVTGEWKGVGKPVLRIMAWAVLVILCATIILASASLIEQ